MKVSNMFTKKYNAIPAMVAFDTKWKNSTGYLDYAVKADIGLSPGGEATCVDDFGRKVIFVGTAFGNVVVFERYTDVDMNRDVIVGNYPDAIRSFFTGACGIGSRLTDEGLEILLGAPGGVPNIGTRLERLLAKKSA